MNNYAKKKQETFDKIAVTIWLAYLLINILSHYIVLWFGGVGTLLFVWAFWGYFQFVYCGNNRQKREVRVIWFVLFAVLFCLIMQFCNLNGSKYKSFGVTFDGTVWNMFTFFPISLSAVAIVEKSSHNLALWIKKNFIILSFVTLFATIVYLLMDNSSLKITATSAGFYAPFTLNYQTVAGFAVIAPISFAAIKTGNRKFILIAFAATVVITVTMASFLIALLAMILGIVIYFVMRIKNPVTKNAVGLLSLILIFWEMEKMKLMTLLNRVATDLSLTEISRRISQLVLYFNTGIIKDTTSRITLYGKSLHLIFRHPITGNLMWDDMTVLYDHSTLMDIWGGCGIFVLALFVMFLVSVFRYNKWRFCATADQKAALVASFAAFLFFITFNPLFASPAAMTFWILAPILMGGNDEQEKIVCPSH